METCSEGLEGIWGNLYGDLLVMAVKPYGCDAAPIFRYIIMIGAERTGSAGTPRRQQP
jgi:hypothetical protein